MKVRDQASVAIQTHWSTAIDRLCHGYCGLDEPGLAVGVLLDGQIVHGATYGSSCLEHQLPMTVDTVLPLGSVSKHMCAVAILQLEEAGQLRLQEDIRTYVPELPDFGVPVTLRHLLTMTSGLPDGLVLPLFAGSGAADSMSRKSHLQLLGKLSRLQFLPGDRLLYSNSNYMLLSLTIERVSGRSFGEFMRDELFLPLGMTSTQVVAWMHEPVLKRARGYAPGGDQGGVILQMAGDELCGDGGVHSTLSDMLRWLAAYRKNLELRQRLEAESTLNDGQPMRYRSGIEVERRQGIQKISHGGGLPGYLADFAYFPERDVGIVTMANSMTPGFFALADRIFETIQPPTEKSRTAFRLPRVAEGLYVSVEPAYAIELRHEHGEAICYMMGERAVLEKIGDQVMVPVRRGVHFELRYPPSASPHSLELRVGAGPWFGCQRIEWPISEVVPQLESYIGQYHSMELGETHHVKIDAEGRLCVSLESHLRSLRWGRLLHLIDDVFTAPVAKEPSMTNVIVRFIRDHAGVPSGFEYNINRARGMYFHRSGNQQDESYEC